MRLPTLTSAHRNDLISIYSQLASSIDHGLAMQKITFDDGWDDAGNSDVRAYTKQTATDFLENYSDDLKAAITGAKCLIKVSKGCHQANDPHFTLSEVGKGCNNDTYAGTRSVHVPC